MSKENPRTAILSPVTLLRMRGNRIDPPLMFDHIRTRRELQFDQSEYPLGIVFTDDNATEVFQRLERCGVLFGAEARAQIAIDLMKYGVCEIV